MKLLATAALWLLQLLRPASPQAVLLNEVLVNPDADGEGEWAELYNSGSFAADLTGISHRRSCHFC